jgi:hypothetical protein
MPPCGYCRASGWHYGKWHHGNGVAVRIAHARKSADRKKKPRLSSVEMSRPKFAPVSRMGGVASPALGCHGAHASHDISISREVMASTEMSRSSIDSKAAGAWAYRRLCLVPHTCRFLASVGLSTDSEGLKSSLRPHSVVPRRGQPVRPKKSAVRATAFVRLHFGIHQKRNGLDALTSRPKSCLLAFGRAPGGREAAASHAHEHTTA